MSLQATPCKVRVTVRLFICKEPCCPHNAHDEQHELGGGGQAYDISLIFRHKYINEQGLLQKYNVEGQPKEGAQGGACVRCCGAYNSCVQKESEGKGR